MTRDYRGEVARIRRTRLHPRRTDWLYLHLRELRDGLRDAFKRSDVGDVLDIYCGARPYEPLFSPETRYVGLDIDDAYGCADVVSREFLPFPDASFDLCVCTQAFYFVPSPERAVPELARVLRPDGWVVITQPIAYPGTERLYTETQLRELFSNWRDVSVVANGGTAVSVATLVAFFMHEVEKRAPHILRPLFVASYTGVNVFGEMAAAFERRHLAGAASLPANLLLLAKRPAPAA